MYFVEIVNGVAINAVKAGAASSGCYSQITEEQFVEFNEPRYAEVVANGVIFGSIVPWDKVPETDAVIESEPALAPTPTPQDDTDAMLIDHEYRLTLLELGIMEV